MPRIKVLHIIKTLNLGGAETNLLNLIQQIDRDRFEAHVGYSFGGELEGEFVRAGARLFKYAEGNHKVKSLASIGIVANICRYLQSERIDIVHTHNFSGHIWGVAAARLAGKKIIEHVHDFRYLDPEDFKRRRGYNEQYKFVKYLKKSSHRVIVLTQQNKNFLINGGFYSPEAVIERQNGIPLDAVSSTAEERKNLRRELALPDNHLLVLTPVRVAPEKNVDLILRIAPQVIRQVRDVIFVIAGDGPLMGELQEWAARENLSEHVRFIGFCPDVRRLMGVVDVMLLPSFLELHSIAILEAMSMQVPVVVSQDVGCNNEFIRHGENGFLHDPFNDKGWAETLVTLLRDAGLRRRVGEAGYATSAERFNIRQTSRSIEKIYDDLMA